MHQGEPSSKLISKSHWSLQIQTKKHGHKIPELRCVTMIDPVTGWFKIKHYNDKKSITVANIVKKIPKTLPHYHRSGKWVYWSGFSWHVCKRLWHKKKIISMQNPHANAIVEHTHQMLRNLIQSFELQDNPYIDMDDPWLGIHAAAAFAMCSTYHTTLHMMPGQLLFGRDMTSWLDCDQSS